jgi:hypothetical protein
LPKHQSSFGTPPKSDPTPSAKSSSTSLLRILRPGTSFVSLAVVARSGGRGQVRASAEVRASSTSSRPTARCGC